MVHYVDGGKAMVENISLRCRRHNGYEFDVYAGTVPLLRERRAADLADSFGNE